MKDKRYIYVKLEVASDPDDGMQSCYTGCVDGNGNRSIASIDENNLVSPIAEINDIEIDGATQLIVVPEQALPIDGVEAIANAMKNFMEGGRVCVFDRPVRLYTVRRDEGVAFMARLIQLALLVGGDMTEMHQFITDVREELDIDVPLPSLTEFWDMHRDSVMTEGERMAEGEAE